MVFLENLLDRLQRVVELLLRVGRHQGEADERVVGGDGGRYDGVDEDARFEKLLDDEERQVVVADEEGDDGGGGVADLATHFPEAVERVVRQVPEMLDPFRLVEHDVERRVGRRRGRRGVAGAEDIGTGVVAQEVDDGLVGRDEATDGGEGFAEGAHDQVHVVGDAEVVASAPPVIAEDAESVRLIDHDAGVVFLRERDDLRQLGHVALHAEDAVDDDQLDLVGLAFLELLFQRLHIVVLEFQFGGEREAMALDDGGVVELVPEDVVLASCHAGDDAQIHLEAGGEDDRVFLADEFRQAFLELDMQI